MLNKMLNGPLSHIKKVRHPDPSQLIKFTNVFMSTSPPMRMASMPHLDNMHILTGAKYVPLRSNASTSERCDDHDNWVSVTRNTVHAMHNGSLSREPNNISNFEPRQVLPHGPESVTTHARPNSMEAGTTEPNTRNRINNNLFYGKCLSVGHIRISCNNKIRCYFCYGYNHIARFCFNKNTKRRIYRVKPSMESLHNKSPAIPSAASPSSAPPPNFEVLPEEFHGAIALITTFLEGCGWRINYTS